MLCGRGPIMVVCEACDVDESGNTGKLWKRLHERLPTEEKIQTASAILKEGADARIRVWLFEWIVSGEGAMKVAPTVSGLEFLSMLLDALPAAYPIGSQVPTLMAQLRNTLDLALSGSSERQSLLSAHVQLIASLLDRSALSFTASVEQTKSLLPVAVEMFTSAYEDVEGRPLLLSVVSTCGRLLLRSLKYSNAKKAFKTTLEALPCIFNLFSLSERTESWNEAWAVLGGLLRVLVGRSQLEGFEKLARTAPVEMEQSSKRRKTEDVHQMELFHVLGQLCHGNGSAAVVPALFSEFVANYREFVRLRDSAAQEAKLPPEFWFFMQLSRLVAADDESVVSCLVRLWSLVREHGAFRPREDPQRIQVDWLGAFVKRMLTLAQHGSDAAWVGLTEALKLDPSQFERHMSDLWTAVGACSARASCVEFSIALLQAYAHLADLAACVDALVQSLRTSSTHADALLSGAFLDGVVGAAGEISTGFAPAQAQAIWETLLSELQGSGAVWWCARLLEHFVQGLNASELFVKPFRALLLKSFKTVNDIRSLQDESIDSLSLSFCVLGRRLECWDLPGRTTELSEHIAHSLGKLARSVVDGLGTSRPRTYILGSVQWLAYCDQRQNFDSDLSPVRIVSKLVKASDAEGAAQRESRQAICTWIALITKHAGTKTFASLASFLVPQDLAFWRHLATWREEDVEEAWRPIGTLWVRNAERIFEHPTLCVQVVDLVVELLRTTAEGKPTPKRCGALLGLQRALTRSAGLMRISQLSALAAVRAVNAAVRRVACAEPSIASQFFSTAMQCLKILLRSFVSYTESPFYDAAVLQEVKLLLVGDTGVLMMVAESDIATDTLPILSRAVMEWHAERGWISQLLPNMVSVADETRVNLHLPNPMTFLFPDQDASDLHLTERHLRLLVVLMGHAKSRTTFRVTCETVTGTSHRAPAPIAVSCAGLCLAVLARCVEQESRADEPLLTLAGEETVDAQLLRVARLSLHWLAEHPEGHTQDLLRGTGLLVHALCSCRGELWKELIPLIISSDPALALAPEGVSFGSAEQRLLAIQHLTETLLCRVTLSLEDAADPSPLVEGLASVMRNLPPKPLLRPKTLQRLVPACHALLALRSTPDVLLTCEIVTNLFLHLAAPSTYNQKPVHMGLGVVENLVLNSALHAMQLATDDASLESTNFDGLLSKSYGLLSNLFGSVPREGTTLPTWTQKPHVLLEVMKLMLAAVYGAPSGGQAVRVATDVSRLWEAFTQGGTRLVARSAGRQNLATYQARIQRSTKGFTIMLIAHAIDQQRQWAGVEAAVQRCLQRFDLEQERRQEELQKWKDVTSILQTGMTSLLVSLEGSDHLKQCLYVSLREPLNTMFKELNENYQDRWKYKGTA